MISKSELSFVKSLHQKKYREQNGLFLVEGAKMVEELLNSSFSIHSIYALGYYLATAQISAKLTKNIKIREVTQAELKKMSLLNTPNQALAVAYIPQTVASAGNPAKGGTFSGKFSVFLDRVQDPGNMGTIIRTADWFGLDTIVASEDSVEFYNPKVVQASMGSLFRVGLFNNDLSSLLSEAGIPVYGAVLDGKNVYRQPFGREGILLMGNESQGISPGLRNFITHPVSIPRFGAAESLNVSAAAAILCSEIRRAADE